MSFICASDMLYLNLDGETSPLLRGDALDGASFLLAARAPSSAGASVGKAEDRAGVATATGDAMICASAAKLGNLARALCGAGGDKRLANDAGVGKDESGAEGTSQYTSVGTAIDGTGVGHGSIVLSVGICELDDAVCPASDGRLGSAIDELARTASWGELACNPGTTEPLLSAPIAPPAPCFSIMQQQADMYKTSADTTNTSTEPEGSSSVGLS